MKTFEVGKTYSCKSACDQNCTWSYTVTARTAKTVTLSDGNKTIKCRIIAKLSEYSNGTNLKRIGGKPPALKAAKGGQKNE